MDKFIKVLRVILILIFLSWGISWLSVKAHHKDIRKRNSIENIIIEAGNLPGTIKKWYKAKYKEPEQSIDITLSENLYKIGNFPSNSKVNDSIYLLYYKYLGKEKGKVYLQNIKNGDIAFSWDIPLREIMNDLKKIDKNLNYLYYTDSLPINMSLKIKKNIPSIPIYAPLITDDFSLIFHCGLSFLYKIDKNSKILWKTNRLVHHSIELDKSSNIWTCSIDLTNKEANYRGYREDAILCISPNGKELNFFPLTNIFRSNNLFKKLIGSSPSVASKYGLDPYHINDIKPITSNGKYWDRGDLFLSLRSQSMVLQYRPSTDSIIWNRQGPWLGQHDINILNDSIISFFNNNIWFFKKNNENLSSNIAYYNFNDDNTIFKYNNIFKSTYEGRQTQIINKGLLIEATKKAKYYILDSIGNVNGKFYIPYYSDFTRSMQPTWARVYFKNGYNFIIQ